jgi:hypothetical protein
MSEDATGSGSGELGGSSSTPAAGGASGAPVAGGVGTATRSPNGGASRLGRLVSGLPLPVHDHETPSTGGELDDYLRTAWGADHVDPAGDPHDQYVTDAGLATALAPYATDADLAGYLTPAAADALFVTPAEGAAAYAAVDHTHPQVTTGQYHFQTNPAMTDPGSGNFRSNTGAAKTATALAMDQLGAGGTDITTLFNAMRLNDTIFVQDLNDAVQWVRYQLTGAPTLNSGWAQVPVSVIASGGTIAGSQLCVMQLTLTAGGGGGGGGASLVAADALWDAKGDLVAATGADTASRLPVGATGQLLSADSAQATGLAWVANPVTAHTALPDAHHAKAHDHTAADGTGVLTNDEHDGFSQYTNLGADPTTPAANRIRLYSKDNGSGVSTLYYRSEDGAIYELPTLPTGGGGGSGAPSNASYVTLAAEGKLAGEAVLGSAVVMSGLLAARPAFGTAGRLYLGTDTDLVYRDTGGAWETFATRAGGGSDLPLTGGTLTGALTLQGASTTATVLQAKLATDTQPRFRANTAGLLEWGNGVAVAPDVSLSRPGTNTLSVVASWFTPLTDAGAQLGANTFRWSNVWASALSVNSDTGYLQLGATNVAPVGAVRLKNAAAVSWRNAANTNNLSLAMDASDRLALAVGSGALTTSATAGSASALPGVPAGYLTLVVNGTAVKVAYWT